MRFNSRVVLAAGAVAGLAVLAACGDPNVANTATPAAVTTTVTATATETAAPTTVTVTATPASTSASTGAGGQCVIADLNVTLGQAGGAAGSTYSPLTFTNTGFEPCTIAGFPTVAYVAGADLQQVGGAAAPDGEKGAAVTLKPGQSASAQLQQVTVQNFPEEVCKLTDVAGLKVSLPGSDEAAFVPQADRQGCAAKELPDGQFQMSVQSIAKG